jgi:hypothetical protein
MATMKRIRLLRTVSGVGREGETVELSRWAADAIVNRGDAKHVATEPPGRVTTAPGPATHKGGKSPENGPAKKPAKRKAAPAPAPAGDSTDDSTDGSTSSEG